MTKGGHAEGKNQSDARAESKLLVQAKTFLTVNPLRPVGTTPKRDGHLNGKAGIRKVLQESWGGSCRDCMILMGY